MRKHIIAAVLSLMLVLPAALAETVTVHGTLGRLDAPLVTKTGEEVGVVWVWNTKDTLEIQVRVPVDENKNPTRCYLSKVYVYLSPDPVPTPDEGYVEPDFENWPYQQNFKKVIQTEYGLSLRFDEDLEYLRWGQFGEPWLDDRVISVAVRTEMKSLDAKPVTFDAWSIITNEFVPLESQLTAWGSNARAYEYELQHPKHGQFAGPVHGLGYVTPTHTGITGDGGGFPFYPGEEIDFWIGSAFTGVYLGWAPADQQVTPQDVFGDDTAAFNLVRLLLGLDGNASPGNGTIDILAEEVSALKTALDGSGLALASILADDDNFEEYLGDLVAPEEDAIAWLETSVGSQLLRRNISKSPEYAVDKPKLDIIPVWVPAQTANGFPTTVEYEDTAGGVVTRDKVKPLLVTYTEKQEPNTAAGIIRSGSDIITAVSMDDGATWKRFNVSHMANKSSFKIKATGEKFPGDSRGPVQKIVDEKILIVWESAYARGGKPSFAIKTDDGYPHDDAYVVNDVWGVRGRQGSVDYNEDKDVGDQGIGEIPYYAVWACRGVLVYEGNAGKFPDNEIGDIVWFKPERLTSGRRDAFFTNMGGARGAGFAVAWQEDPGGLLPGSLKGGGDGWSGATVHKKTDIWYSYISMDNFDLIDDNWDPDSIVSGDELSEGEPDDHGQQPEISNRPKWRVPMSLPVRVSDNNTVNTDNLKVQLDPETGLPLPGYIPLDGALEEDFLATEHEGEGSCDDSEDPDGEDGGNSGAGGGWGMARYAYSIPELGIVDINLPSNAPVWDKADEGDYRPEGDRWFTFVNKAGATKTVAVTADGRPLDGDTGAARPFLIVMSGGWAILGYEETKGLGIPPEGEHGETEDEVRPEPDDKGKNIIYHSFKFNQPDRVSAGNVLNLPALDDGGNLIPIYYKDAAGNPTEHFRQYKTENARRIRFIAQSKSSMGPSRTSMVAVYRQGREGSGKPADIFAIRAYVPTTDKSTDNPYRFSNLLRYETGAETSDPSVMRYQRKHMNMSSATVESMDPVLTASDNEGNTWQKVGKYKQYQGNLSDESFANPYSDAKGHRGFLRGDTFVLGYEFTPNWGRLGGDHSDFFIRRSFDGGQTFTTDPNGPEEVVHDVIERDPETGEYSQKQYQYGRGEFEPGRNVSLLKGNKYTVTDPRLVPPMGFGSTVNKTYPEDDTENIDNFTVAFGTAEVLHGLGEPLGVTDTIKKDIFYTRTTDGGATWLTVPWVINPDSSSPDAGETVYRFPWLAQGDAHQGHAQLRTHPSGTRIYAIWHQWTDGDEAGSPHDAGDDIWFRRIDFMPPAAP